MQTATFHPLFLLILTSWLCVSGFGQSDSPPITYSGIYTVGCGGWEDFSSLTGDGGLFQSLNNGLIMGDLNIEITSDLVETGLYSLEELNDEGNERTVVIRPSQNDSLITISGSVINQAVIRLDGADRIILNGWGHKLKIRNTYWNNAKAIELINGASGNTIKECLISTGWRTNNTYGIYSYGTGNDSNTFQDNHITQAFYGIGIIGSYNDDNLGNRILNNVIGDDTTEGRTTLVSYMGVYASYQSGLEIYGNEIKNMICYNIEPIGIYVIRCNQTSIRCNYIHDLIYTKSTGFGADGIFVWAEEGMANNPQIEIANNIIHKITGAGSPAYITSAIFIAGSPFINDGIDLYHNSIHLESDSRYVLSNNDSLNWSAGLVVAGNGPTGINLVNNILLSGICDDSTATRESLGAAIWCQGSVSPFDTIEHNIYFSQGQDTNGVALMGTAMPPDILDMTAWQVFCGSDEGSIYGDPMFTCDTLQLSNPGSPAIAEGTSLEQVVIDFSGNDRHDAFPTIGARECTAGCVATWTGMAGTNWNALNNWDFYPPSLPDSNSYIYIPGTPAGPSFPLIPQGQCIKCKRLHLGNGAEITIGAQGTLQVIGE